MAEAKAEIEALIAAGMLSRRDAERIIARLVEGGRHG